ncbi:MAG: polyribonucleotide nucleotidyltransferase [Deltaproteobacteria bacterium]|nr:polyribonucleotide nucleotidyltransferase [Deltaproteobacteria bacterium]MBW2413974.1 polyribonucleotide nucleotidyltransferase [Deltaproteobacteria bacterium]
MEKVELDLNGKPFGIETGRLAKQSNGSVVVTYGASAVLVTVNRAKPREGIDFFPLTVDYVEKVYAAGRIPGGFFKREGRLTEKEILTSRFIDRALRPLFPSGYRDETQVTATVLACEDGWDTDMLAFVGASAAVMTSDLPFPGPIGAVRVCRADGKFVANPDVETAAGADINMIVAGSRDALVMVEGGADQAAEADMIAALRFAHDAIQPILDAQDDLVRRAGKTKIEVSAPETDPDLRAKIEGLALSRIQEASRIVDKKKRYGAFDALEAEVKSQLSAEFKSAPRSFGTLADVEKAQAAAKKYGKQVGETLHDVRAEVMRARILDDSTRIDGRGLTDIRSIECTVPAYPRLHGSAVFQRGETQALCAATLGGGRDEQLIEGLQETYYKNFYLHYNFPPFSVGEVRPLRGPNRREIGHGALADRAIRAVLPDDEDNLFTIRLVSEVLESNGSSSMATVCGGILALMDAGIAIKAPVAGIAMGLIQEGDRNAILSDILGDEDHLGDMDFKVAGTREGITAIQMDLKIEGLDWNVMERALAQARDGRLHILDCMERDTREELPGFAARTELSRYAPRTVTLWIKPDRIRDLIGPGGKVIRSIQEVSGAKIDVDDSGRINIFAPNGDALDRCQSMVEDITQEAEVGKLYVGKVKRVTDFGAFVEIFPGTDGLLHISELTEGRVDRVEDVCVEGDEVMVKCLDVDPSGKIRLSRRAAIAEGAAATS